MDRKELFGYIMFGVLIWCLIGAMIGFIDSSDEQRHGEFVKNDKGEMQWVKQPKSGCIYNSLSAFTNPGYILTCELLRNRFEYEGVDQVFK